MHKVEKILKPATYCRYRARKLKILRLKSNLTQNDIPFPWLQSTDFFHRMNFLSVPWYKNKENFHNYDAYWYYLSDKTIQRRSDPFRTCFQRRHCSRCTFIDGKIPEGFRSAPPWRVLFFGTDQFAVFTLKLLNENRLMKTNSVVENLEVVSNQAKTPVRTYANEAGLVVHDWPVAPSHDRYDVGVLVSFGHLISEKTIHQFPYGILNVHPSLLPRWRGASPIIHTVLNGDTETGISIMELRPKHFDIGPLLVQKRIPVPPNCTSLQLHDMLGPTGAKTLIQTLYDLPTLERFEVPQLDKGVTYAHKLYPNMAYIDWENQTVDSISRQYRAMHEVIPLRSQFGQYPIKLKEMVLNTDTLDKKTIDSRGLSQRYIPPGTPIYSKYNKICWIKCKDGWAGFRKITLRKSMSAEAFYNGYLQQTWHKDTLFTSHRNHLMENVLREKIIAFA